MNDLLYSSSASLSRAHGTGNSRRDGFIGACANCILNLVVTPLPACLSMFVTRRHFVNLGYPCWGKKPPDTMHMHDRRSVRSHSLPQPQPRNRSSRYRRSCGTRINARSGHARLQDDTCTQLRLRGQPVCDTTTSRRVSAHFPLKRHLSLRPRWCQDTCCCVFSWWGTSGWKPEELVSGLAAR